MGSVPPVNSCTARMTFGNEDTLLKLVVSEIMNILPLTKIPGHCVASCSVRRKEPPETAGLGPTFLACGRY